LAGPIAGVVSGARRHHPALHPTPRRPCLLEPAAGRSDPTGPATRRAHRDAADRTRSAARLGRAAQTAQKLNMRTGTAMLGPQFTARPERRCRRSGLPQGGTASMPVREKGTNGTGSRASRPVSRPRARAERRETAGLSAHRHGIHCTDRLRAGGRWIRTSDSRSRGGQTVMRDCLEKRERICWGTEGSNPFPSSGESAANLISGAMPRAWENASDSICTACGCTVSLLLPPSLTIRLS
jgi:hypothetical protein